MADRRVTEYMKFMSEKERQEILDFALLYPPSVRLCIHVLDKLGLRVSEAVRIRIQDIDFENKILTVDAIKQKKILTRIIPDCLLKRLKVHIAQFEDYIQDGYIMFGRGHGTKEAHISPATIRWFFVRFRKKYGYNKPYYICADGKKLYRHASHTFRSRWISQFIEAAEGNVRLAQLEVGHKESKTTIRYWRFAERQEKTSNVVNKMFKEGEKEKSIESSALEASHQRIGDDAEDHSNSNEQCDGVLPA